MYDQRGAEARIVAEVAVQGVNSSGIEGTVVETLLHQESCRVVPDETTVSDGFRPVVKRSGYVIGATVNRSNTKNLECRRHSPLLRLVDQRPVDDHIVNQRCINKS